MKAMLEPRIVAASTQTPLPLQGWSAAARIAPSSHGNLAAVVISDHFIINFGTRTRLLQRRVINAENRFRAHDRTALAVLCNAGCPAYSSPARSHRGDHRGEQ